MFFSLVDRQLPHIVSIRGEMNIDRANSPNPIATNSTHPEWREIFELCDFEKGAAFIP
jgi:hypothetical protein